jgi:hypothetical protein
MDKNISSSVLNKSVPFLRIEPLHRTARLLISTAKNLRYPCELGLTNKAQWIEELRRAGRNQN